ncbi:MAG: hypothetical protein HYY46_06735 [Deltaproteobacteria bacterium]|nr:hypothetical protein [Deltaproteobacteria bacterium]
MARQWDFLQKWAGPLVVFVILVILAWLLWSYSAPPPSSPSAVALSWWVKAILLLLTGAAVVFISWFLYLFTGAVTDQKINQIILFCYLFIVLSLLGWVVPFVVFPLVPGLHQAMVRSPIGVVAGCSLPLTEAPTGSAGTPKELKCDNNTDQWVVNIGGTMGSANKASASERTAEGEKKGGAGVQITKAPPKQAVSSSATPSEGVKAGWPPVRIQGGLVVPLYFVVLSLMGAAVSMTRRVPEYQGRLALPQGNQKAITREQAREYLVFQIMQVVSAPLIAITAYYLVEPSLRATSVALGFASGFASETILLVIRALVEKLEPKTKPQT